jgi:hypothetical protein
MFRLAMKLGMTVGELGERMDSSELTEWIAFCKYHEPFGDEWRQVGMLISAILAPHCKKGSVPPPQAFMPIEELPQQPYEIAQEMAKLADIVNALKGDQ